jgi:hypothetical protein
MHTHRFGRKIKLPASIAIKHQIRVLMAQDELKKAESQLVKQSAPVSQPAMTKERERPAISPKQPIFIGARRV